MIIYNYQKFNNHQVVEMYLSININRGHKMELLKIWLKNLMIYQLAKDRFLMKNILLIIQTIFKNKKKLDQEKSIYKIILKILLNKKEKILWRKIIFFKIDKNIINKFINSNIV